MDHLHQTREEDTQDCYVDYARCKNVLALMTAVLKFFSLVLVFYYLTGWCGRKRSTNDTLAGFVVHYNMFPFTHTSP